MTKTLNIGALALIAGVFALTLSYIASAQITDTQQKGLVGSVVNYTFFATSSTDIQLATTTSATSTNIAGYMDSNGRYDDGKLSINGAKKVVFYFGRYDSGGNTGNSKFELEVSPDGSTWYDFNKLKGNDISSTATSTVTIAAATSTVVASMDLTYDTYKYVRCIVNETTDGGHTCKATVEY